MEYDIIYIEDDPNASKNFNYVAERYKLSCLIVGCLNDLIHVLTQDNAKVWVVDGNFPVSKEGESKFNAPSAVGLIRNISKNAKIILYSGNDDISATVGQLEVEYRLKMHINTKELIEEIFSILRSK